MHIRSIRHRSLPTTAAALVLAACSDAPSAPALATHPPAEVRAATAALPAPSGFVQVGSWDGIRLYRKDYRGGMPDWVTVADLRVARVRSLTGAPASNDRVGRRTFAEFWRAARGMGNARVMVNGTFFSTNDQPSTGVAFGLKVNGKVLSRGYAIGREYPGLVRTLALAGDGRSATIATYAAETFAGSAPDVVGALDPAANKSPSALVARTFAGVRDGDGDGAAETLLLFSSALSTQSGAATVLKGFGARQSVMLDGGGSTGLMVDGTGRITPSRTLPHVIAVFSPR